MRSIEEVNQLLAAFNQCVEEGATRTISEKEADTLRVARSWHIVHRSCRS